MYTNTSQYVSNRDSIFYYIRRVRHDVRQHYASKRISFSLRTKSQQHAFRAASSVTQRLQDCWLGLRLRQMDIPAIHLVKADDVEENSPLLPLEKSRDASLAVKNLNTKSYQHADKHNILLDQMHCLPIQPKNLSFIDCYTPSQKTHLVISFHLGVYYAQNS